MSTQRIAWFNPFSGIAGDMALGACLDAGADLGAVVAACQALGVPGWTLTTERVLRGGLEVTRAVVTTEETGHDRSAGDIIELVTGADLPDRVHTRAVHVFERLATVEGRLHGEDPAHVHLHEVGGLDAIVDVVGVCAALESLGIDRVFAGPVATGYGTVTAAHGVLPVPAPAVLALLTGAPVRRVDVERELTTPTGAALLAALAEDWGPMPAMTITSAGHGGGSRDLAGRVNAVQVVVGTVAAHDRAGRGDGQPLLEMSVNVDDATGETLAHAVGALLDAGAADAWITPVLMKKGRPGHVVSVLCDPAAAGDLSDALARETGSFGVRARMVDRWPSVRRFASVDVDGHPVRIKISPARTKVEHDDAADVARRTGRPLREVVSLAEEAARRRRWAHPTDPDFDPDEPA